MRYAQIKSGAKLHLVYEPGEGYGSASVVRAGHLSLPLSVGAYLSRRKGMGE